jgi:NADPH:quinone reductase-like Zn-dependent oxidoreductase
MDVENRKSLITMKAAVRSDYGSPGVLKITEAELPVPGDNEILIRVHAATVSRTDCGILWGRPLPVRFFTGLRKPRLQITGCDFAGEVAEKGKKVKAFSKGDRVMGFSGIVPCGSHAQYLVIDENKPIRIPASLNYETAAACLEGAFYANCCINSLLPVVRKKVLVNGATGAIGSAAVQLLKYHGAEVTVVCAGENFPLMKFFGADRMIDYEKEDFTKDTGSYDVVVDAVGKSSFMKCKRILKKNGIYTSSEGFINLLLRLLTKITGGKKVMFSLPKDLQPGLHFITDLAAQGKFHPVIDRKYSLETITDAYEYVASGEKIGNVILHLDQV